jgi:hypothetical protein
MRRPIFLFASLSALILGACSLTQNLDDLKANAGKDGGAGSSATGGTGGGDAQAKLCEKGVDCTGCADCTTFCQCGAPASGFDGCMVVCQGSGGAGGTDGGSGAGGSGGTGGGAGTSANAGVKCGTGSCDPAGSCCVTNGNSACETQCNGTVVSCDGPEDCGSGEVCCGSSGSNGSYTGFACKNGCSGVGDVIVCHASQDCPTGTNCTVSAILTDYSVCK